MKKGDSMKDIDKLVFPDDLLFSKSHEWVKDEQGIVIIGISDYAQNQLGDVVYVELPQVGDKFVKGDEFGTVESVKAVSELYLPISGEVVEVNESLNENPALVNDSPYTDGWMMKIKAESIAELTGLLDKKSYLSVLKGE